VEEKISIVIIALNEEKYLPRLLDSLYLQTNKNFEIIIVNNNSKDKTQQVAESYSKKFDEYNIIFLKEILGPGHARNFGAKYVKYKFILFFDSDTILDNNFIEKLCNKKNKYSFDIASFLFKKNQKLLINILYSISNFFLIVGNNFGINFCCGGIGLFCKKEIYKKIGGFDERILFGEDSDYTKRASKIGKYKVLNIYNESSPRRYKSFNSIFKVIKYNLYRLFSGKEIYNKNFAEYEFGGF